MGFEDAAQGLASRLYLKLLRLRAYLQETEARRAAERASAYALWSSRR